MVTHGANPFAPTTSEPLRFRGTVRAAMPSNRPPAPCHMEPPQSIPRKPYSEVFLRTLVLAAVAGACTAEVPAAESSSGPPPPLVRTAEVRAGALRTELRFPAEIRAAARSQLASGADGAVVSVSVDVGDVVRSGQVLLRVDDRLPRARVEVARAELARAEREAALADSERDRIEQLKAGTVSDLEVERARSAAEVAQARLTAAEAAVRERLADLAQFTVVSPYDGVVADRRVDPGTWVQPGQPVLDLVAPSNLEVIVEGSRILAGKIAPGDEATIVAPAGPVPGRVTGVVPALDPLSRTLRIRLVPKDGAAGGLVPGDAVDVGFEVELDEEGVLVTTDALLESPDETRIFELEDGVTALRTVRVLGRSGDSALVRGEGLEPGDRVVTRGNERLRPGQKVRLDEPVGD